MDIVNYKCNFLGKVQGVGFRYTSLQIAGDFAVVGFVRNEADGSVSLEVEGSRNEVTAFLDKLKSQMSANIQSSTMEEGNIKGFNEFIIER